MLNAPASRRPLLPRTRRVLPRTVVYLGLILVALVTLMPMVYALFASFKPLDELLSGGTQLLPRQWHPQNFAETWKAANFSRYFLNSVYVTGGVVLLNLFSASMLGYVLARQRNWYTRAIEAVFGFTLFLGVGTLALYPQFFIALKLGLLNLTGVILVLVPGIVVISTFLIKAYCLSLGQELYEAAALDGCSFYGTYWRVALPLMVPILSVTAILAFQGAWNAFQVPLVFTLSKPDLRTVVVGVYALQSALEGANKWNLIMAGAVMSLVPVVVLFLALQRQFIRGVTEGALKG